MSDGCTAEVKTEKLMCERCRRSIESRGFITCSRCLLLVNGYPSWIDLNRYTGRAIQCDGFIPKNKEKNKANTLATVIRTGNSLAVCITKQCKAVGADVGDIVEIAVKKRDDE